MPLMSRVAAVSMIRNSWDIAPATIACLILGGVKDFYIVDHMPAPLRVDLRGIFGDAARFTIFTKVTPPFYQGTTLTWLAQLAREDGCDVVLPFDADEFWVREDEGHSLADSLCRSLANTPIAYAPVSNVLQSQSVETFTLPDLSTCCYEPSEVLDGDEAPEMVVGGEIPFASVHFPHKAVFSLDPDTVIDEGHHGVDAESPTFKALIPNVRVLHIPYRSRRHMDTKKLHGLARQNSAFAPTIGWQNRALSMRTQTELNEYWLHNSWIDAGTVATVRNTVQMNRNEQVPRIWRDITEYWPVLAQDLPTCPTGSTGQESLLALALDGWGKDRAEAQARGNRDRVRFEQTLASQRDELVRAKSKALLDASRLKLLNSTLQETRAAFEVSISQVTELQQIVEAMLSSRSWRWTRWLRRSR